MELLPGGISIGHTHREPVATQKTTCIGLPYHSSIFVIALKPRIRFVAVPVIACFALLLVPALATAATWIPPVDLGAPSEFSTWQPRPEIAISGAGGGVAIWPQEQGLGTLEAASMSLTGTWGSPVTLAPNEWGQRAEPELAMNEAGEAVAIWKHVGPEQSTIVARVRAPSGEWGPQETLSPEGSPYGAFDVAVGPAGEAVAVWSQIPRFGSNSEYRIESSFMPAGGHWEPAVTLSDPEHESYSPQVAIAPTGRIVAAFYGYLDSPEVHPAVQVAEKQGGQWSPPQAVSGAPPAASPKVEASTAGTTVIWEGIEGEERWIEAASRTTGGEWGHPVELSGPESIDPEIGADAAGNAVAIWKSVYKVGAGYIEGSSHPVGGQWSESTVISGQVLGAETEPRLAVAPNGQTLAAWSVWREPEPRVEQRLVEAASGSEGEWEESTTLSAAKAWAVRPAVALDGHGDGAVAWWAANPTLPQATEFVTPRPGATSGGGEPAQSNGSEPLGSKRRRATVGRIARVREGKAYLEVNCPGALACKGDLRLVALPTGTKGKAIRVSARTVHFAIPAGHKKTIAVRLNRKGQQLISAAGRKGVGVRLVGHQIQQRGLLLRRATGQ
jgi:hypothetical protein